MCLLKRPNEAIEEFRYAVLKYSSAPQNWYLSGSASLDPKDLYMRVHGKGQRWREVELGEYALKELRKYIRTYRARAHRDDPVVLGRYHKPLTVYGLDQVISHLGEWAGIEGIGCSHYTLRHWYSQIFMEKGDDIYTLSQLLGHTRIDTTEEYLKSFNQRQARKGSSKFTRNRLD